MAKKKLLDTLIDLAKRPNKEMARIKKRKKHKKEMAEMKKERKLKAKQREEEKKFFTPEAVEKRRKETDKRVKEYAARMEKEFAKLVIKTALETSVISALVGVGFEIIDSII